MESPSTLSGQGQRVWMREKGHGSSEGLTASSSPGVSYLGTLVPLGSGESDLPRWFDHGACVMIPLITCFLLCADIFWFWVLGPCYLMSLALLRREYHFLFPFLRREERQTYFMKIAIGTGNEIRFPWAYLLDYFSFLSQYFLKI